MKGNHDGICEPWDKWGIPHWCSGLSGLMHSSQENSQYTGLCMLRPPVQHKNSCLKLKAIRRDLYFEPKSGIINGWNS